MTKEQATKEATRHARDEGLAMVVTFNPYSEESDEANRFGYFPVGAVSIFKYEKVVKTIQPRGN